MQMAPTFTHVIDISELHDTYSKPAGEIKVIVKHVNGKLTSLFSLYPKGHRPMRKIHVE